MCDREVTVTLPIDSSGPSLKGKLRPIVINVLKDGSYMVRAQEMKLDQIEQLLMETVDKSQTRKCSCARMVRPHSSTLQLSIR